MRMWHVKKTKTNPFSRIEYQHFIIKNNMQIKSKKGLVRKPSN